MTRLLREPPARPAKQARSKRTIERLLDAAEAVLSLDGLEGATVPAIAGRAGLSVGVVYRRFPDKDALLRAVYNRFLARALRESQEALDPARWAGVGLAQTVRALIGAMVRGYRERRGILRALTLYAHTHPNPAFRRRAEQVNAETLRPITALLLSRGGEILHPDPETAISFGLLVVAFALRELVLSPKLATYPVTVSEDRLGEELARMLLGYLNVRERQGKNRG